jgi:hypothetical protein
MMLLSIPSSIVMAALLPPAAMMRGRQRPSAAARLMPADLMDVCLRHASTLTWRSAAMLARCAACLADCAAILARCAKAGRDE